MTKKITKKPASPNFGSKAHPVGSASELYRQMKKRGLQPRGTDSRDQPLLLALCKRLGCPDDQLQAFLDANPITIEVFLTELLNVAEPFSKMYEEVWDFLEKQNAVRSTESLYIQFGFKYDKHKLKVDLEKFREHRRIFNEVQCLVIIWPTAVYAKLWMLLKLLRRSETLEASFQEDATSQRAKKLSQEHEFDKIANRVLALLLRTQTLIKSEEYKLFQEANGEHKRPDISNLLPIWASVVERLDDIPAIVKREAYKFYTGQILPYLSISEARASGWINKALDILALPFWRHRWHLYEVWCNMRVLLALDDYMPTLEIVDNRLPIDGYDSAIIAKLRSESHPCACVGVQYQTEYRRGNRKAIQPDLRIYFDGLVRKPDNTAVIVEYKQHKKIGKTYIEQIIRHYNDAAPKSAGLIIANYDVISTKVVHPPSTHLVSPYRPGELSSISKFEKHIRDCIQRAGIRTMKSSSCLATVLLDVSESMDGRYYAIADFVNYIHKEPRIQVFHFADSLRAPAFDNSSLPYIDGGTDLEASLAMLRKSESRPSKVLVVSDEHLRDYTDVEIITDMDSGVLFQTLLSICISIIG